MYEWCPLASDNERTDDNDYNRVAQMVINVSNVVVVISYAHLPYSVLVNLSISRSHGSVRVVRTTSKVNGKC